jgi:23S rRNA pseudouridine1911/1915/1917 synthase
VRLIDHLKALGQSNKDARDAMQSGKVRLKGVPTADGGREVDPADVELLPNAPRLTVGRDVVMLRRDAHLAVVWKPGGMLSVPAAHRRETNVLAEVGKRFGTALPVHRLDEGTSGLMLVAHTERAQTALKDAFEVHDVERVYLAIGWGRVREGTVRSALIRDRGDGRRGSGPEGTDGKLAITHLSPLETLGGAMLLQARLQTGRTHQVRIHCAESGCPLLGDELYAPQGVARRFTRVALHAAVLGFTHPVTGEVWRFEAPLADDLEQLRRRLIEGASPGARH